jgi:ABC-type sugar transport system ATPase subunit
MNPATCAEAGENTQNRSDGPLLRFESVVKQFGGTLAVNDVTLDLFSHEVLALLGGNGAGKSTLIKILAGVHAPTSGQIFFGGRPVSHFGGKPPIAFIHQDLGLIEWMTVAENLAFGLGFPRRGGLIRWNNVSQQAEGRFLLTMGRNWIRSQFQKRLVTSLRWPASRSPFYRS